MSFRAFEDFKGRIAQLQGLLDVVAPGWDPQRSYVEGVSMDVRVSQAVLCRSSLVLAVSYFEGFLKDLIDEVFDTIADGQVKFNQLNESLRGQVLLTHVKKLRESDNPKEVWGAAAEMLRLSAIMDSNGVVSGDYLPREDVKRGVTSIEPVKINTLLKVLDDDDISRGPMSKHGARLRGLKQVRDNAVHGNEQDLQPLGYADIVDNVDLLLACAEDLQVRVEELLEKNGCLISLARTTA